MFIMERPYKMRKAAFAVALCLLVFWKTYLPTQAQTYTETFYVCEGGDGSLPETATCATAYDAADFNTVGNWDTDDSDDGKIGPNDIVRLMDDGGDFRTAFTVQQSGLSTKPITIGAEGADNPVINGADIVTGWTANQGADNNYGDTSAPGSADDYGADFIYAHQITVTTGGDLQSIKIWFDTAPGSGNVKCALYTDSSGADTLVTNSECTEKAWSSVSAGAWTTFTVSGTPTLSGSTTYWIAIWSDTPYRYAKGAGGSNNWEWDSETYGTWPSTYISGATGSFSDFDAYAVVRPAGVADVWDATSAFDSEVVIFDGTRGVKDETSCPNNLDAVREWCKAGSVLHVYSSGGDPDTVYTSPGIEASKRVPLYMNLKDYITVDGLEIKHSDGMGIRIPASDYITIQNCTIHNGGGRMGIIPTTSPLPIIQSTTVRTGYMFIQTVPTGLSLTT
jgi:hypothetical protein